MSASSCWTVAKLRHSVRRHGEIACDEKRRGLQAGEVRAWAPVVVEEEAEAAQTPAQAVVRESAEPLATAPKRMMLRVEETTHALSRCVSIVQCRASGVQYRATGVHVISGDGVGSGCVDGCDKEQPLLPA